MVPQIARVKVAMDLPEFLSMGDLALFFLCSSQNGKTGVMILHY